MNSTTATSVSPQDAALAILATAEPCTAPSSPWYGSLTLPAHVGTGEHTGPFQCRVELSEALAIIDRDRVINSWDPDTGALISTADAIDGFRWTFPTVLRTDQP